MGISGAPDIFQEKMTNLMCTLEYVRTYTDNLLVITMGKYDSHLKKFKVVCRAVHRRPAAALPSLTPLFLSSSSRTLTAVGATAGTFHF